MGNLFLSAMTANQLTAINQIKENKKFVLKLINDLSEVFYTYHKIVDGKDSCTIYTKASENYNYSNAFSFTASKDGITFMANPIGYYKANNPKKSLGSLYEKYKDNGTIADTWFFARGGHGCVRFKIPINPKDSNIRDILKDIIYLMEFEGYKKVF